MHEHQIKRSRPKAQLGLKLTCRIAPPRTTMYEESSEGLALIQCLRVRLFIFLECFLFLSLRPWTVDVECLPPNPQHLLHLRISRQRGKIGDGEPTRRQKRGEPDLKRRRQRGAKPAWALTSPRPGDPGRLAVKPGAGGSVHKRLASGGKPKPAAKRPRKRPGARQNSGGQRPQVGLARGKASTIEATRRGKLKRRPKSIISGLAPAANPASV
ncbi:hypothetical protein Bca52824_010970 [Brassica carinata]|uniref:Uncharacterized protein n=1 Tax=Brassica carinata TaxID=52824 RepID=A0A8X8BBR9_BRACI|nr:hypothetical protein Bca52824_010970 [Brassica carinata]